MHARVPPPGTFAWIERITNDPDLTLSFYCDLFGWSVRKLPRAPGSFHFAVGEDVVAGVRSSPSGRRGSAERWISYVHVDSLDEVADRIVRAGGHLRSDVQQVGCAGRMLIAGDPAGAEIGLWEPDEHPGAEIFNQPGSLCWNELSTYELSEAATFYESAFDWTPVDTDLVTSELDYLVFENGGRENAGMLPIGEVETPVQPSWSVYLTVEDLPTALERVEKLGGSVAVGPSAADVGQSAVVRDSMGVHFSLMELQESAPRM